MTGTQGPAWIWAGVTSEVLYIFKNMLSKFNNKTGIAITAHLIKSIRPIKSKHLLKILKWASIGAAAFIADTSIFGAIAGSLVKNINEIVSTIKGVYLLDIPEPFWYISHPFMVSWAFLRHAMGGAINVPLVYNTWLGLNVLCVLVISTILITKRIQSGTGKSKSDDRDIRNM